MFFLEHKESLWGPLGASGWMKGCYLTQGEIPNEVSFGKEAKLLCGQAGPSQGIVSEAPI